MTHWYETLFANYGEAYDKESFTQGTSGEVDFVERELGADRSKRILDIACGTGRHAAAALRPGGKLLLTTLNALFPLFHSVKDFLDSGGSGAKTDKLTFDWMTFRERAELTFTDDAGRSQTVQTDERYHTPPEMRWLLKTAGFAQVEIFGCRLGRFSREHVLTPDDFEMLVVAERAA